MHHLCVIRKRRDNECSFCRRTTWINPFISNIIMYILGNSVAVKHAKETCTQLGYNLKVSCLLISSASLLVAAEELQ